MLFFNIGRPRRQNVTNLRSWAATIAPNSSNSSCCGCVVIVWRRVYGWKNSFSLCGRKRQWAAQKYKQGVLVLLLNIVDLKKTFYEYRIYYRSALLRKIRSFGLQWGLADTRYKKRAQATNSRSLWTERGRQNDIIKQCAAMVILTSDKI